MFQPDTLVLARQRRGIKKTVLARTLGITAQTLLSYEDGKTCPSPRLVQKMAEALGFPESFFHDENIEPINVAGVSFRALSRMTASQRDAALASGALSVRLAKWLAHLFDFPEPNVPDLQSGLIDPEAAAAKVRALWALGDDPIEDLLYLAETNSIRVFSLSDDCKEIDAFSFWYEDMPIICLGTYKTAERILFDLAHEIGHLVMHRDHGSPRGRTEEHEANQFASSLLMPAPDVLAQVPVMPSTPQLITLKRRWRVSLAALNYRLHGLGMLSDWHYRSNCIEIARYGRAFEPNPVTFAFSSVLTQAMATMKAEGKGRHTIAAELNITVVDLDALTQGLVMTGIAGGGEDPAVSERPDLRLV